MKAFIVVFIIPTILQFLPAVIAELEAKLLSRMEN